MHKKKSDKILIMVNDPIKIKRTALGSSKEFVEDIANLIIYAKGIASIVN